MTHQGAEIPEALPIPKGMKICLPPRQKNQVKTQMRIVSIPRNCVVSVRLTTLKEKQVNKQPIPRAEAKEMVIALNKIIESSFHGHGKTRVCSLGDVML